ncbi:hypothetical protein IR085_09260, partial [Gemella palaticanis]|nr:hypothetical protein [Gemella palaticanis]MBF0716419.1 hypothetical protein [Gemella palaticanis]NYS48348.1 hypothetical protein [Gemella palaticanis]NYS48349.1 hypothetical protein [Gemella palaticanis]
KQIAKAHDVSYTTVIRSLYECKTQVDITNFNTLPEYLCFDEIMLIIKLLRKELTKKVL